MSVEYLGRERVYDIEVELTHNFVANGIFAHNTYLEGAAEGTTARQNNRVAAVEEASHKYGGRNVATIVGARLENESEVWEDIKELGGEVFRLEPSEEATYANIERALDRALERMETSGERKRIVVYAPEYEGMKLARRVEKMAREKYRDRVIVAADAYKRLIYRDTRVCPFDVRARHGLSVVMASCADEEAPVRDVKGYLKQAFGLDVDAESFEDAVIDTLDALLSHLFTNPLGIEPIWADAEEMRNAYETVGSAV